MQIEAQSLANAIIFLLIVVVSVYKSLPKILGLVGNITGSSDKTKENEPPKERPTLTSLAGRIETLEMELRTAHKDKEEAIVERDKAREEIGVLRSKLQTQIDALQKRLDALESANTKITLERDEAVRETTQLLRDNNKHLETIKSMSDELNDLEIKVEALTIDNKARKSFEVLVDEFSSRLIPALVSSVKTAIKATKEIPVIPPEATP